MWQNTCLYLPCKTSLCYDAINIPKVSITLHEGFVHVVCSILQWTMYMGRNTSTTKTMHGSKSIWVHRALNEICPNKSARSLFKKRIIDANFWGANLTSVLFKLPFASLTLLRKSECDFEFLNFEFARFVTRNKILITDLPNWRCFHRNAITALHWFTLKLSDLSSKWIKVNYFEVFYFKNLAAVRSFWLHSDSPSGMAGWIFVDQYFL